MALICPKFKTRLRVVGTYYMQYDLKKYVFLAYVHILLLVCKQSQD